MLRLPSLSLRFRLSAAIAVLFALMLLVSAIGMLVLARTEVWMNTLHKDTLAEVSEALDLSRESADLATSAPFLYALFPPFQLEQEKQRVLGNLERIKVLSAGDAALDLPVARLESALDALTAALAPHTARQAELDAMDRDLVRLNARMRRLAEDQALSLAEREGWAALQQLTESAIGAGRANALIELGEFSRRYTRQQARLDPTLSAPQRVALREIEAAQLRSANLFVLKHRNLAARLDAENALFQIRQEARRINRFAEAKVAQAEARLSQARAATSDNLQVARNAFLTLTAVSLLVAITSALYVSRYVARNLHLIAAAMRSLAAGNHRTDLPKGPQNDDEIGQLYAAFHVFRESARKLERRTRQVGHQNALFSRVFRNIKDGVAIATAEGWVAAENDNLRQLLRLPPARADEQAKVQDLMAASSFERRTSARDHGGFEEYADPAGNVLELRRSPLPNGEEVWLLSETTERKKVEQRLEEIRRVEALGKVSGEVAHDFGNILSSIAGNLHLLEATEGEGTQHLHGRIRSALDLGTSLIERLLAFARKQHLEPQATDLGMLVGGMADLLEIAVPSSIDMDFDLPADPVWIKVDPGQLESAVLNLCVNAGQAIGGDGRIEVRVTGGEEARLTIRDTGSGMPPEVLARATEPFYSNRSDGSGTGLGLSMVDGFVHQSGGHLTITSRCEPPDQGTTVTLHFPVLAEDTAPSQHADRPGCALVVDDDPAYLSAAADLLERLGFEVTRAASHRAGLEVLAGQGGFDLVLSDLNLDDGASGWDILQRAQARFPACRLALMSTRETYRIPDALAGARDLQRLRKPLTLDMMRPLAEPA